MQPGDWDVPGAVGTWSIGDIVRHLAPHEILLVDILEAFPAPPTGATVQRAGTTVEAVLAEYDAALARARDLLAAVPLERRREHSAQIVGQLDRLRATE